MIFASILTAFGGAAVQKAINTAADSVRANGGGAILDGIGSVATTARAAADTRNKSLVAYSKPGRVEPICYVDADCANSPMLPHLLQAEMSIFMGYWLRAFSMENTRIGGVTVASRLEQFSTHRSPDYLGAIGLESLDGPYLPFEEVKQAVPQEFKDQAALEADSIRTAKQSKQGDGEKPLISDENRKALGLAPHPTGTAGGGRAGSLDLLDGEANMAVGRIFNVEIVQDQVKQTVPIVVRMNIMTVPTETMVHIYTSSSQDIASGSRLRQWWRGRIDFWRDLVMAQDLIDAHKKNLRSDTTGFYSMMLKRRSDNINAALVSGVPSAAASATIVIMSTSTAEEISLKLGNGGLNSFQARQRFFQQGYAMLLAVIDDRRGRVRLYTRDIAEWSDVDAKALETSGKGGGLNVGDVLAAFRAGGNAII